MSDIFSERLTSLRKERRISQKEAAAYFGISQALLSHYENGIRQCSTDFLIKAAQFYSVTTDYLLGISSSKTASDESISLAHPGDGKLSYETLSRAFKVLCRHLESGTEKNNAKDFSAPCMYLYKAILQGIAVGKLPSSWLRIDSVSAARELIKTVNLLNLNQPVSADEKISLSRTDEAVPQCIQTVTHEAERIFTDLGSQMLDRMSIY